jgi:hypothetical protein
MKSPLHRAVRPVQHRRTKKPLSEEVQSAYKTLLITVLILGLSTTGTFLYVSSLKPAKGYLLKELQANYDDLESIQRKLNQEVIEAQSFIHIQNSDVLHHMEVAKKGETAYIDESPVAEADTSNRAD